MTMKAITTYFDLANKCWTIALILILSSKAFGQSTNNLNHGNLDLNFNYGQPFGYNYDYGNGEVVQNGGFKQILASVIDNNGKLMVGGIFSTINGYPSGCIARLNPNGSIDRSFNCSVNGTGIRAVVPEPSGTYIIGGYYTQVNSTNNIRSLARINSDGTFNNTLNIGTGFYQTTAAAGVAGIVFSSQLQSDGKIIVGGEFQTFNGTSVRHLVRLNANGTLDGTFSLGSGFNNRVRSTVLLSDGKILVAGDFTQFNGTAVNGIVRLNPNGSLDNTFNVTAAFSSGYQLNCIAIQPWNGKIVVGGSFTTQAGSSKNRITRFNTDGSVDGLFINGTGFNGNVNAIIITDDQKLLVGSSASTYNGTTINRIVKLNTDGTIDNSFTRLNFSNFGIFTLCNLSDGYYVGGTFTSVGGSPIECGIFLNDNGTSTISKNIYVGFSGGYVFDIIPIPSTNRIVLIGTFTHYNGVPANRIIMLEADGSIVSGFNYGTGFNDIAQKGFLVNDKLIVVGSFTSYNGTTSNRIIRLNLDGTIDNNFSIGTGLNSAATTLAVQPDQKIVVAGGFASYNGTTSNRIVRINTNGSIDGTFVTGTGFNSSFVYSLAIDGTGRILCGGTFSSYNGTSRNCLVRLSSTGALDGTFTTGSGPNSFPWDIKLNSSGKILIVGQFTTYNGTARQRVALLNTDGTLDANFGTTANANDIVYSALVEPGTDKFIIAGNFTTIGGATHNRIVKLNTNGTVDAAFEKGTAFGSSVDLRVIKYSASGQILAGGFFSSYHTFSTPGIVQINGCTKASNPVISGPTSFCTGTPITLTSSYATGNIWSTGATTQSISVSNPGTYTLQSNSGSCITNKVAITITENALPSTPTISGASLICPSSTVTLTGPSGLPGYVWSNGATTANATVNAAGTYTLRTLNAAGCTSAVSNSWVVSDAPTGGWLGNNTNWNDPANWCGGVPTSTTDVQLPTTTNNFPVISGTTEVCRNLEIPSGRTLNINSAARLNLYGDITGSGNITGPLNSELRVLGSTSQTLKNLSVGILRINNTAGASLGSNVVISKDLDLVNGVLSTNSYSALLLSTAETLTETANAYVNGKVRVSSKFVGTGSLNLMGVSIASGADNLDTVLIERRNEVPTFGTNQGIGYVWSIRAGNSPAAGRNVTFSWRDGITNGRNLSSMQVYRRPEGSSDWVKVGAVQNASSRSITVNTNSFSDWTVSDTEQPLPVTFGYFSGNRNQEKVTLNWSTLTEINASHFEIEASVDGKTFVKVGTVTAAGNSNSEKKYAFSDINTYNQYYRLKQVDKDGLFTYSKTISLATSSDISFEAYPNPTTGKVSIFSNKEIEIQVFNPLGKRVLTLPIKSETEVDLSCFGNGLFTLRSVSDASVFIQKVLVR